MICAIPRASLRSVLFGIAPRAPLARRVSIHTAGSPAAARPSYSQALSEHASRPIRSSASPRPRKKASSASGSLATRASVTIRPSSSTTQMAVSSSDTSSPAKCFTAAPPRCSWPMRADHAPPSWAEQPLPRSGTPITPSVSLDEILIEAGQDTQDTPEIGQLDHVLCRFAALLEVPGQAAVAVGERAERGLDPPPDRQGREAAGGGVAERDLDVDGVPVGRRPDHRAGVDRVDLDPPQVPPGLGRPLEQGFQAVRVVDVLGGDQDGEDEAERAGQEVALDAPHLLVAVHPALALLRSRGDAPRIHDPGRRRRGLAEPRPGRRGQQGGDVRPDAVAAEAVPVAAHGLPRAEVLGQRSPAAALGPEIKTAVDHRTDVPGQGRVGLEQGSDQLPFRVRQVARVASAIILVPLTIFHRPHLPPPSLLTTELGAAW